MRHLFLRQSLHLGGSNVFDLIHKNIFSFPRSKSCFHNSCVLREPVPKGLAKLVNTIVDANVFQFISRRAGEIHVPETNFAC